MALMKPDLLLRNSVLVDPGQGIHRQSDIAVADGKIVSVADSIPVPAAAGCTVLDLTGRLISPGWIDLHVHMFPGISHYGIDPDAGCLHRGVTTALDAGSAGAQTFPGFRRFIVEKAQTRIFALMHISCQGMLIREVGELEDIRYADVDRAVAAADENRDIVKGIKVRLTPMIVGKNAEDAFFRALKAAQNTGLPLMVHPNGVEMPLARIVDSMRPGDVLTHLYHGWDNGILDDRGKVKPEIREAHQKGIRFDLGHGKRSFTYDVARKALDQGIEPDTFSSDLHFYNIDGPVYDLATTLSKTMALGFSLDETIRRATSAPAQFLGLEGKSGTAEERADADLTVFRLREGDFDFEDCEGEVFRGSRRIVPEMVIRKGRVIEIKSTSQEEVADGR